MSESEVVTTISTPIAVARSTAATLLKVSDTDDRMIDIGLRPAFAVKHESGNGCRMYYLLSDVEAARARINADEIAELKKQREAIDARIAALGGEVVQ